MSKQKTDYRALMTRALTEIKDLKSRINDSKHREKEPIAIVGASCRFPGGANDLDAYWDLLSGGRDGITEVPADRWPADLFYDPDPNAPGKICTRLGGFLNQPIAEFDAAFFGISPREAESMDPQQRLLLELCWEALEHANYVPEQLFKSDCGVFMGVSSLDNSTRILGEAPLKDIDGYYGTGTALAPVAGRISYYFGFTGPSYVVDTACSSSLLSLHLACESLRRRECDMALGGGVQLLMHPGISIAFTKAHMLSVDGRCKTFDAAANGYTRGEGGGVLVLKRLSDALSDGDRILALIRGSAANQDGASGGLTVPSGPSQEAVIRRALSSGDVDPAHVNYIEAHGTGTPLGDPIEIGALSSVYGGSRSPDQPLRVGSVKTNIGHLEASAGIASAIKVLLSLRHRTIAPHLHLKNPNPLIPWNEIPIKIPTRVEDWHPVEQELPLIAGISSFGFSGTNVHLVMSEPPEQVEDPEEHPESSRLLVVSARNESALRAQASQYARGLRQTSAVGGAAWTAFANTAATARTHFKQRFALSASSAAEAAAMLEEFSRSGQSDAMVFGECPEEHSPKIAMLFTGQGSQYSGMGAGLYEQEPVFKEIIDRCDAVMRPFLGKPLTELLFRGGEALNETGNTQPALYALEVALAELWKEYGGAIHSVVGHSVGEYAAAATAGIFSIEDGARLISERARLMQSLPDNGGMLAVFASKERVEKLISGNGFADVDAAAFNSPLNLVVSGDAGSLKKLEAILEKEKIDFRVLTVSHAFHSPLMEPVLEPFRKVAESISYSKPEIPVYSNVTGLRENEAMTLPEYWVRHVREPVQFEATITSMLKDGFDLFVEAGPKRTLLGLAQKIAEAVESPIRFNKNAWLPMLRPKQDEQQQFFLALGGYWCRGGIPTWNKIGHGRVDLPTYPFQRQRHWKEVAIDGHSSSPAKYGEDQIAHPLLGRRFASPLLRERFYETVFNIHEIPMLDDHRIYGELVVAGASHLALIIGAAENEYGLNKVMLSEIVFPQALVVPEDGERTVQLMLNKGDEESDIHRFRLVSFEDPQQEPAVHATGYIDDSVSIPEPVDWEEISGRCSETIEAEQVYSTQEQRHIVVGESYQWLKTVKLGKGEAVAELVQPKEIQDISEFSLHPGLIDSCFGVLVMTAEMDVEETFIPFSMEALHLYRRAGREPLRVHARRRSNNGEHQQLVGDITIETESGEPVARFVGLEGRKAGKEALLALSNQGGQILYTREWEQQETPASEPVTDGTWLVCCDESGYADALIDHWRSVGRRVIDVRSGKSYDDSENDSYRLDFAEHSQLRQLLRETGSELSGILNLLPLNARELDWEGMEAQQRTVVGSALLLFRILASEGLSVPLISITAGSCAVIGDDRIKAPHQASVKGMMHSALIEYPHPGSAVIDVETDKPTSIETLSQAIDLALDGETGIACRGETVWAERLKPLIPSRKTGPAFDNTGTYLVTGGLGALGLELSQWLIEQGARSLILLGRSNPGAAVLRKIESFREAGADVAVLKTDIGNFNALSEALERAGVVVRNLKGIFHLAGELADGPVSGMEWPQFYKPFEAKAAGAWNLHRLTEGISLDHFVLFSSMASLTGSAAQANYASANALLDALAEYRSEAGLAGLSINWGPWKETGMAAQLDERSRRRLTEHGVGFLPKNVALKQLEILMYQKDTACAGVLSVDWNLYPHTSNSLLRKFRKVKSAEQDEAVLLTALSETPTARRPALLQRRLVQMLSASLKLSGSYEIDPRERLFDLGVDSLIAIELKNRLQIELGAPISSTLLFDYPTLEALVRYLLDDLLKTELVEPEKTVQPGVSGGPAVDDLSDEDAEAALMEELMKIKGQTK